jgi:hypothetical protein
MHKNFSKGSEFNFGDVNILLSIPLKMTLSKIMIHACLDEEQNTLFLLLDSLAENLPHRKNELLELLSDHSSLEIIVYFSFRQYLT